MKKHIPQTQLKLEGYHLGFDEVLIPGTRQQEVNQSRHVADGHVAVTIHIADVGRLLLDDTALEDVGRPASIDVGLTFATRHGKYAIIGQALDVDNSNLKRLLHVSDNGSKTVAME